MLTNLNLCPVCGIDPEDTKFAFPTDIAEHRYCRDTGEVHTDENDDPYWFVTVYEIDRAYGGPRRRWLVLRHRPTHGLVAGVIL